ncbi:endonuclease domain-containing 1 protein-like [Dipodomys merriami]|uniref:endonuclease domain-containing 1 protein-like n=1 Tax=Dipodomys merriami TaxID=94247 RepID=UPI003855AE89
MAAARWPALLALLALPAPREARLVREPGPGFAECGAFFYAGAAPRPPPAAPLRLCQRWAGAARFATEYDAAARAPRLSAFRAARPAAPRAAPRALLEPQIDDPSSSLEEATEEAEAAISVSGLGSQQALNSDYQDSDYQPGQLYPFALNDDPHEAVFTLTNSVPMTPSFRDRWYTNLRSLMDRALLPHCGGDHLFLLAGAVPSGRRLGGRVSIPESVWLAACCAAPGGGWAIGFIKHTQGSGIIEDVMVKDLERLLPHQPQLFQDNCGEAEQDTEKMKKILEVVNQVQDEERALQSQESTVSPAGARSQRAALGPPEAAAGSSGFWGLIATPIVRLFQLIYYLVAAVLRNTVCLLWYVAQQVVSGVESCLYRLGSAAASYFVAIGAELVSLPWKVLKVVAKVIRAVLRVLCCLLKAVCRVLSVPIRVLVDVASFPVYTMGAIPVVCKDIALGLGGTLSLLFDTAFGTMGGLFQAVFSVFKRIGYKVTFDNSGEL